jgi:hypothetical protein
MVVLASLFLFLLATFFGALPAKAGQSERPPAEQPRADVEWPSDAQLSPPPAMMTRDEDGRVTVRAARLDTSLRLDGRLDEPVYTNVAPITGFVQIEPRHGAAATEKTDVWLSFDEDNVYVSVRCWQREPRRLVAKEMRRDHSTIWQGDDVVAFIFDTFHDRQNAVAFAVNALGGRMDAQVTNESEWNANWNPVWDVVVVRSDDGWSIEAAIPFASLRYRGGRNQVWGFNIYRTTRWNNEVAFLTPMPRVMGQRALLRISLAATLVGMEAPIRLRNLEVKPYGVADVTAGKVTWQGGLDLRQRVSQNVTADFTLNTDFAQVEADEQQVNLSRFSLFFPEKREFFLENQGLFSFGGVVATGPMAAADDTPILFYSRRIGLQDGHVVPLQMGGRLTGRVSRYSIGVLNIQSDKDSLFGATPANFSVLRLKRDVLRKSSIGVMATGRSSRQGAPGSNFGFGVDGTFSFFDYLAVNTYWARTRTDGMNGHDTSYRLELDYNGDRYGLQLERLVVGNDFNPEVGFLRRSDIRRTFGQFRFSPRPRSVRLIRKTSSTGSFAYLENGAGRVELKDLSGEFAIDFQNADRFSIAYRNTYEFVPRSFRLGSETVVPVDRYEFGGLKLGYTLARQRRVFGGLSLERGSFYSGRKTTLAASQAGLNLSRQMSIEPAYSLNWIEHRGNAFTNHAGGLRFIYTLTTRTFASALVQYSSASHAVTTNVRLRWEYRPGSELFVVYNDEEATGPSPAAAGSHRALIVKISRLLRF